MQYRALGRTEIKVSSIGLGCVTFGREIDRDTSFAVLDRALERGINLVDTAACYGEGASESVLGQWMAERRVRDQLVVATKVTGSLAADAIRRSIAGSLQRLQTDRLDLVQFHNWDDQVPLEESLDALGREIDAGRVRFAGCSNWAAWQVAKSLLDAGTRGSHRIESVQPPYSLVQRGIEAELLPLCADQQVGVLSYSPLGAGFLSGKYRRGSEVPQGTRFDVIPGHQPIYFTDEGFRVLEQLDRVAATTGRSMVELALGWVLARPGITSVLIGARHPDHVEQAFRVDRQSLADDVQQELGRL